MPGTAVESGLTPDPVAEAMPKPVELDNEVSPPLEPTLPEHQSDGKGQLKAFVLDDRHFSLVRNFRLADLVTIMNGVCGSLSLFSAASYLVTSEERFLWRALGFPLAGMFFDLFDGKVARWRNEASMLGQELDSLADSLSFGVAPAFCAWTIGLRTLPDTIILTGFICCGIARLARFNATVALVPKDASGKSKYFEGLPIPTSLILVGCMAECVRRGLYEAQGERAPGAGLPFGLITPLQQAGIEVHWFAVVFLGWAMAMVSKSLHVPKP